MKITPIELTNFLSSANRSTYANAEAPKAESLRPGSYDYHFEQDGLTYHDTYFGGRDFVGEEIVYKEDIPVWGLNYYGYLLDDTISADEAYNVLRSALMAEYDDILPVRGPKEFVLEDSCYTNSVEGTLERFVGEENIFIQDKLVYRCWYHGGGVE